MELIQKSFTDVDEWRTEPKFTQHLATNHSTTARLLEIVNIPWGEDYTIEAEYRCYDNSRIDLVIKDGNGKPIIPIECMSAKGPLDKDHATKHRFYCYDTGCGESILLCELADERMQSFIRHENDTSSLNTWVIGYKILDHDTFDEPYITFHTIVSPLGHIEKLKRVTRSVDGSIPNSNAEKQKIIDELALTGLFTNPQRDCLSYNFKEFTNPNFDSKIKNPFSGLNNVAYEPQKTGSKISFFHGDKFDDNDEFKDMMRKIRDEFNLSLKLNKKSADFSFATQEEGLEMFKKLKAQGFAPTGWSMVA